MNKQVVITTALVVIGLAAGALGAKYLAGRNAQECLDIYAEHLRDPQSAELVRYREGDSGVIVIYRAQNAFGTYIQDTIECSFDEDGRINRRLEELRAITRSLERTLKW